MAATLSITPTDETLEASLIAGRYRIEGTLGHGGMAHVYRARDLERCERVAIKVVDPDASLLPGVIERFVREARAAMQLENEHVVRVQARCRRRMGRTTW